MNHQNGHRRASKAHPHCCINFGLDHLHSNGSIAASTMQQSIVDLPHLALKQASMAANEFRSGGLHNHAAALDLIEAFEQNENDAGITSSPPFKPFAKKPQNSMENPCSPTTQRCQMIEETQRWIQVRSRPIQRVPIQSQTQEWRARLLTTRLSVHKIVRPKKDDRNKTLTESKHAVDT